jgi:TolB-like protein/class 3 adenylate cyclase
MAQERVERRLTAILAADVAGYSRLMEDDEVATVRDLKGHQAVVLPLVAKFGGRIIDTAGDGILAEFQSAVDAVECAMQIQKLMAVRNVEVAEHRRMEFRIGLNLGELIHDESRIYGDGINIAARLEKIAQPGGICVSSKVYDEIEGKLDITFEDAGEQQLKNVARPVRIYRVRLDGMIKRPALALPDKPSVAVLPFNNASGDPEQEYFADGVVEDIITALSRLKSFFVIARNSSFTYKGKPVDVKQIARELGVRYVLEGSVRKAGNKVRITARLIDGARGTHVWADSFDGTFEDIFDLQERITASVVGAIEPNLQLAEIERMKQKPPANFDAYDLLLRAQQLWYEFTEESLAAALLCLKKALIIDPTYAPAMIFTARCFAYRRHQGWAQDVTAEATEGLRWASRAVELSKDDSQILHLAANAVLLLGMNAPRAKELVYRSLFLNPNAAGATMLAGFIETCLANPAKGLELLRRAERLDPRGPVGWILNGNMAFAHFVEGRFDEAASYAQKALAQNPRHTPLLRWLAASLAKLEQRDKAAEAVRELLKLEPQLTISKLRARTMYYEESVWNKYADGLRLAGLPE